MEGGERRLWKRRLGARVVFVFVLFVDDVGDRKFGGQSAKARVRQQRLPINAPALFWNKRQASAGDGTWAVDELIRQRCLWDAAAWANPHLCLDACRDIT